MAATDGAPPSSAGGYKRKRDADEADLEAENVRKRGKVPEQPNGHDAIVVDESGGAIVLD